LAAAERFAVQRELLRDDAQVPLGGLRRTHDVVAVDDHAPGCRLQEAGNAPDGGRLAGAVRAKQAEDPALLGRETDPINGNEVAILLAQLLNVDHVIG
jgi:hypothetical protein